VAKSTIEDSACIDQSFPGKIVIVTDHSSVNKDDFSSPDRLIKKYGSEKIIHVAWPKAYLTEPHKMADLFLSFAADMEIKALIISQAAPGTNAAIDELGKQRKDIFIVCCTIQEPAVETVRRANLLFDPNQPGMGAAMVKQVKKQGAKVLVHYSFPRHLAVKSFAIRKNMIDKTCKAEGILFLDREIPDPADKDGFDKAQQFILEDVPELVAKYGEDTAFFCTNCHMQIPLIKAVIDCHAIYPQPCCPSPMHGYLEALEIKDSGGSLSCLIGEASRIAAEKNMTDRLSTWPVSASMLFTNAGAEYAIKWINGEVPKKAIDDEALMKCMDSVIIEAVGEESSVLMTSCTEEGITHKNYKLVLMSYLDF